MVDGPLPPSIHSTHPSKHTITPLDHYHPHLIIIIIAVHTLPSFLSMTPLTLLSFYLSFAEGCFIYISDHDVFKIVALHL